MPSQSEKQHNFMEAVAHDPKFAKEHKIAPSVGQDFVAADKAEGKFADGGPVCMACGGPVDENGMAHYDIGGEIGYAGGGEVPDDDLSLPSLGSEEEEQNDDDDDEYRRSFAAAIRMSGRHR